MKYIVFTGALYFILGKILPMATPVVPVVPADPADDEWMNDFPENPPSLDTQPRRTLYSDAITVCTTAVGVAARVTAGAAAGVAAGATAAVGVIPGCVGTAIGATGATAWEYGPAAVDVALLATKITVKVVAAGITGAIDEARTCIEKEKEKKKE